MALIPPPKGSRFAPEFSMKSRTHILTEGALMVALATILSFISLYHLPQGGDVTAFAMLPIILMSFRNGPKWGVITGFVYSLVQLILGLQNVMICPTLISQIGCILLDYIIPYSCLGLACVFAKPFKSKPVGVLVSIIIVCLIRYLCSFISGVLIWSAWAPAGQPAWLYSLTYNGAYMIPETIITAIAGVIICRSLKKMFVYQ